MSSNLIAVRPGCEGLQPKPSSQAIAQPSLTFQQTSIVLSRIPPRWSSWSPQSTTSPRSVRILRAALHTPLQLRHRSSMSLPRLPSACSRRLLPGTHTGLLPLRTLHLQLLAQAIPPARPTSLSASSPRLMGLIPPLPLRTASQLPSKPSLWTLLLLDSLALSLSRLSPRTLPFLGTLALFPWKLLPQFIRLSPTPTSLELHIPPHRLSLAPLALRVGTPCLQLAR
jgi:hypothetical protein